VHRNERGKDGTQLRVYVRNVKRLCRGLSGDFISFYRYTVGLKNLCAQRADDRREIKSVTYLSLRKVALFRAFRLYNLGRRLLGVRIHIGIHQFNSQLRIEFVLN
jgi:hypothetical protein